MAYKLAKELGNWGVKNQTLAALKKLKAKKWLSTFLFPTTSLLPLYTQSLMISFFLWELPFFDGASIIIINTMKLTKN